ncbi:MAG: hypothetical protein L0Y78_01800 [candidate division NC10 bacterium]|nr:hypothetical protein [candidate division NC10 bacterium]HET7853198.1 hypothetical protein [Candidatus Methylomirabilis sp.]
MGKKIMLVLVGLALAGGLSACATEQYGIPPGGPQYASWSHLWYSNSTKDKPKLTKAEWQQAKDEKWWGTPIRYNVDELE